MWHVANEAYFRLDMSRTWCRGGENSGTCGSRVIDSFLEISGNSKKSHSYDISWWWWIAQSEVIMLSRAHGVHARRFHLNRESKTAESVSVSERERETCYRDAISAGWKNIHICGHIGTRARDYDYQCCNLITYHLGWYPISEFALVRDIRVATMADSLRKDYRSAAGRNAASNACESATLRLCLPLRHRGHVGQWHTARTRACAHKILEAKNCDLSLHFIWHNDFLFLNSKSLF